MKRLGHLSAKLYLLVACLASGALLAQDRQAEEPLTSEPNRPWPAPVYPVPEDAIPEPLSATDALGTFHMPPGYRLELVAAEPLVQDPILMEFDGDGRLWVLEMQGFAINQNMDNSFEPINHLVVLEDTDTNGVYDKRSVFMDKLVMPRAFKILDGNCALVGEPPNLWKACDTDGDLQHDTKELVDDGFSRLGVVEHGANGLFWGMDNVLRVAEHDYDVALEDGKFITIPSLNRGQWGVTQDDAGRIYRNVNTDPLFVDYLSPQYFARNPNLARTSGLYDSLVRQEDSMIWPARPTLGLNRGYRREVFREDGSATYYGGVSSPMIYRGTRLPEELHGQPFVVDGPTNIVHLLSLQDDGAGRLSAEDFYERGEFLASTDERFRPVALTTGWDGTIYIADMYRGVSQDGPLQTDYLKTYIAERELWKAINRGRIYRVVYDGMEFDTRPSMSDDSPAELVAHLSHPNGWWRDTAQQLLVQRADPTVVPELARLAAQSDDYRTRLHALWTLDGLDALELESVMAALGDARPEVRASAIRLAEPWLARGDRQVADAVMSLVNDGHWQVRRQLAASLGELPEGQRLARLVDLLKLHGEDPVTVDAAISGLAGQESGALEMLIGQPSPVEDAVASLAASIGRTKEPSAIQALLAMAGDAAQTVEVRKALLRGAAAGLGGGQLADLNIVAGGRAGAAAPGVRVRRGNTVEPLGLPQAPASLMRLAESSGELQEPANEVVALVSWPGKPAPPARAPRTPEEEQLFLAGRQSYATMCAACHKPEGRGGGTLAADLDGSRLVMAAGSVPARILFHGKEGALGLMPPLGAAMSDEDMAAMLTYIRGAWSNSGSPVSPAEVKEWRQAFAHRQTPWTEAELDAPTR